MFDDHNLIWRGNDLCVGRSSTPLVSIVPRVRHGEQVSA